VEAAPQEAWAIGSLCLSARGPRVRMTTKARRA